MPKIIRNLDTPESRQFWQDAQDASDVVHQWPEHKRIRTMTGERIPAEKVPHERRVVAIRQVLRNSLNTEAIEFLRDNAVEILGEPKR